MKKLMNGMREGVSNYSLSNEYLVIRVKLELCVFCYIYLCAVISIFLLRDICYVYDI